MGLHQRPWKRKFLLFEWYFLKSHTAARPKKHFLVFSEDLWNTVNFISQEYIVIFSGSPDWTDGGWEENQWLEGTTGTGKFK